MTFKQWSIQAMEKPELKPMDIIVVDGQWFMPHHWLIRWRGLDPAVHCVLVKNSQGEIWNPIFTGIKEGNADGKFGNLDYYKGRKVSIHRYTGEFDDQKLVCWTTVKKSESKGYDFWRQWLLGFVCGITAKYLSNDETRWTCAELPYWAFQENGLALTSREEKLPMPRLFRYNSCFETIFEGIW
jgi:hypothetical protein